jgi:hypothetical protein
MADTTYYICWTEDGKDMAKGIVVNGANIVIKAAPEVNSLVGQTIPAVQAYCKNKGWTIRTST